MLSQWCTDHPALRIQLEIIGSGTDAPAIRALCTPKNLNISLQSHMNQTELARHYREADLFVFPSLGDEWGVVVNEAMSAGLPVLGSLYSQAVVELIREGDCGWVFDPRSRDSTYAGLDRALTTTVADLHEMSTRVRQEIASLAPDLLATRALQALQSIAAAIPQPLESSTSRAAAATS